MTLAIIGAGIIGTAIARELSRYELDILLLEKEPEACMGTSKANSAILHGGFDAIPGTLKARLNVRGNALYHQFAKELSIPFENIGSLVLTRDCDDQDRLVELKERGEINGVKGLEIWDRQTLEQREPELSESVCSALYSPSAGIICPFQATFAFLENAMENGVTFLPDTKLLAVHKRDGKYLLRTDNGEFLVDSLINAAGVDAGHVASMLGDEIEIIPRKGQYRVLDKGEREKYHHVLFGLPEEHSKGVLVVPTVHGNVLLGPTSEVMEDRHDLSTDVEGIDFVDSAVRKLIKEPQIAKTIRLFSGVRASTPGGDFRIEESENSPGCIHVAGIDSPGLTAAPAIAEYVAEILSKKRPLREKEHVVTTRRGIASVHNMRAEERHLRIQQDKEAGEILCRCEMVTLAEVREAIRRPGGARTVGGVKRRVRPGSGRCQGGFCESRILKVLQEELALQDEEVQKEGRGSWMMRRRDD